MVEDGESSEPLRIVAQRSPRRKWGDVMEPDGEPGDLLGTSTPHAWAPRRPGASSGPCRRCRRPLEHELHVASLAAPRPRRAPAPLPVLVEPGPAPEAPPPAPGVAGLEPPADRLLRLEHALARYLPGTPVRSAREWVARGELPATRLGRLIYVSELAMRELVARARGRSA